jgi:hypothetical protein
VISTGRRGPGKAKVRGKVYGGILVNLPAFILSRESTGPLARGELIEG